MHKLVKHWHWIVVVLTFSFNALLSDAAVQVMALMGVVQTQEPYIQLPVISSHLESNTEEVQS